MVSSKILEIERHFQRLAVHFQTAVLFYGTNYLGNVYFIYQSQLRIRRNFGYHGDSLRVLRSLYNKVERKMDATPSFGVTMISEVPSNPQLTLGENGSQNSDHIFWTRKYEFAYFWAFTAR